MKFLLRRLASRMLGAASRLLPPHQSAWARAMERELVEIGEDGAALLFATGCLRAVLGLAVISRAASLRAALLKPLVLSAPPIRSFPTMIRISARPRLLGLVCAAVAVGIGIAYMFAADAPSRYLLMNLAALLLGATAWVALGRTAGSRLPGTGPIIVALAFSLLVTSSFGISVEGASRWISVGPLTLQISFIALPVMLVLYARRPDAIGTAGMMAAALALAVQPDRAMAGVLTAGLLGLVCARPSRPGFAALAAAFLAFGSTLITPDAQAAMPYVDRVLHTAFDVHPLAGLGVSIGAAMLVLPALGAARSVDDRPALLAFGGCWLGVVVAAALGNYPTPLVGYGGSAILGYLLSVALLPVHAPQARAASAAESTPADGRGSDPAASELSLPQPA